MSKECKLVSAKIRTGVPLLLFPTTTTPFVPGILSSSMTRIFHRTIFEVIVCTTLFFHVIRAPNAAFFQPSRLVRNLGSRTIHLPCNMIRYSSLSRYLGYLHCTCTCRPAGSRPIRMAPSKSDLMYALGHQDWDQSTACHGLL